MKVIDRTKAVTQYLLEKSFQKSYNKFQKTLKNIYIISECLLYRGVLRVFVLFCVCFCTGDIFLFFDNVPLSHSKTTFKVDCRRAVVSN